MNALMTGIPLLAISFLTMKPLVTMLPGTSPLSKP